VGRKGKQMARSTSTRSTRRSTRTVARSVTGTRKRTSTPRVSSARRNIKYFTFQYNRDDVSHAANANRVVIAEKGNSGTTVSMSLQEAKSLYDFLGSQIRTR